jgi:hypothetical protein
VHAAIGHHLKVALAPVRPASVALIASPVAGAKSEPDTDQERHDNQSQHNADNPFPGCFHKFFSFVMTAL